LLILSRRESEKLCLVPQEGGGGGDDGGFFILFEETTDKQNQVTITAKYEDGQSATKFSQELAECTGFVGTFHRRSSQNNINGSPEASKNSFDSNSRMLNIKPSSSDESSSTCPFYTPIGAKLNLDYYLKNPNLVAGVIIKDAIRTATPDVIRAIYGVPTIDNTCELSQYKPRDSAVYEATQIIGTDDLTCYNDFLTYKKRLSQRLMLVQEISWFMVSVHLMDYVNCQIDFVHLLPSVLNLI
jgi:hypothetical protein